MDYTHSIDRLAACIEVREQIQALSADAYSWTVFHHLCHDYDGRCSTFNRSNWADVMGLTSFEGFTANQTWDVPPCATKPRLRTERCRTEGCTLCACINLFEADRDMHPRKHRASNLHSRFCPGCGCVSPRPSEPVALWRSSSNSGVYLA